MGPKAYETCIIQGFETHFMCSLISYDYCNLFSELESQRRAIFYNLGLTQARVVLKMKKYGQVTAHLMFNF